MRVIVFAFLLVSFISDFAHGQQFNCNSRVVENNLKQMLSRKYGPPAIAEIQAIAGGFQGPIAVVSIDDIQTLGSQPNGYTCAATGSVHRVDTGQSINFSAQFLIQNQFENSTIRIYQTNP